MVRAHDFFVYIVASPTRTIYVGVTNDLERRVWHNIGTRCSVASPPNTTSVA